MIQYYKRGFENMLATSYKAVIAVFTVIVCLPPYVRYNKNYVTGGCAKDAILILMARYSYPFIALIAIFFFLRLCLKDSSKNIIIRYKSKRRLWICQSVAGLIYSAECMLIVYAVAIIFGLVFFGRYDVWNVNGSCFKQTMQVLYCPVESYNMPDAGLYILVFIMKTLVMSTTLNMILLIEYMTDKSIWAVFAAIVLNGLDIIGYNGFMGLLDYIKISDFTNVGYAISRLVVALIINIMTCAAGWYLAKYREYY